MEPEPNDFEWAVIAGAWNALRPADKRLVVQLVTMMAERASLVKFANSMLSDGAQLIEDGGND